MTPPATAGLHHGNPSVHAPLFSSLIEQLATAGRRVVLDLGRARTETISLLGRFPCRLEIADLTDELESLSLVEDASPETLRERAESLLPQRRPDATDLILCWDILNYLPPPAIEALASRLAVRGLPGTVAHALIGYRDALMPARPAGFFPLDERHLAQPSPAPSVRPAPRYTPDTLTRCMSAFSMERAVLLSNGMQEILFRL